MLTHKPLSEAVGVELSGLDLSQPLPERDAKAFRDLFDQYGLMVVTGQKLSKKNLVDAARVLGEPEIHPLTYANDREVPEILVLDTHGRDGDIEPDNEEDLVGQLYWHTDLAYTTTPNRGALLYPVILPPEGGLTGFIDRQHAYDTLPPAMKDQIESLTVVHSWRYERASNLPVNPAARSAEAAKMLATDPFPDLAWPLVYKHPVNGRKVLNVCERWCSRILEIPEGRELLDQLIGHAQQKTFMYWHRYKPGDVVVWDNWRLMHAASGTKGKHRRLMYRTTIKGGVQFGRAIDSVAPAKDQPIPVGTM